jgi:transposase-like protein
LSGLPQLLLPMVQGLLETKANLMSWVHERGIEALAALFRSEAEELAGPKGRHRVERTHHHWGKAGCELGFGGRLVTVERPRVRGRAGGEAKLPSVTAFASQDPLPARVVEQILLGVSTRGYGRSLETAPPGVRSRGTSKSAASRRLVKATRERLTADLERRLEGDEILALMLDGVTVAEQTLVAAVGIGRDGQKVPLGLWQGSTENAALCTSLLQDLLGRGLRVEGGLLCVIDGSKALRKAIRDVLGGVAVVQRCQVHKIRNVLDHLSPKHHVYVRRTLQEAYRASSAERARRQLSALAAWLDRQGEEGAAASLREGLDETLTVLALGLPSTLRRSLSTTNAIENLIGHVRRVGGNVKRWKGDMRRRWVWLAISDAQARFHRIKGHRDLPVLATALRALLGNVDDQTAVA